MPVELLDHGDGEITLAHVSQGLGIDDVILVAGPQQFQEILSALRERGLEEGETVVPNLGGDAVAIAMPSTRVVNRDPGRCLQTGAQYGMSFVAKGLGIIAQKTQHLTFRDRKPEAVQDLHDTVGRDLTLVMLQQNEAHQLGTEMPAQPDRQRRHEKLALRGQPPFPPIADHPSFEPKILDHEVIIPFEPRACRRVERELLLFVDPRRSASGALPFLPLALGPVRRFLHPRRLQLWTTLQPLETSIVFPKSGVLRLKNGYALTKGRNLGKQLLDKPDKLVFREIFETGRRHRKYESRPLQNGNREKILIRHPFGTDYTSMARRLWRVRVEMMPAGR